MHLEAVLMHLNETQNQLLKDQIGMWMFAHRHTYDVQSWAK